MTTAAIYCRISKDDEGRELGVQRQEEDCRALADRLGLNVIEVYTDNDIGASTRSRKKRRPAYERMLEDARAGRFQVVLAYTNSRLTRRPLELEDLIRLHEQHGTRIETVRSGRADLSTADGRQYARIQASIDAGEAERTAERVARAHLQNAQSGVPVGGTRPFGWADDKRTLDPFESQLLQDAAQGILAGRSAVAIAREWNAAGVRTPRGGAWTGEGLKQVLRSPRLAGWRVYQRGIAADREGRPVAGQYAAVLDDGTWRAVVAALKRPERRSRIPRRGARHYLLTGLLRCGECGQAMFGGRVVTAKGVETHVYKCDSKRSDPNGHGNAISGGPTDAWVAEQVVFASEHVAGVDSGSPSPDRARVAELNENIAAHEDMIDELMVAFRARRLSSATVFRQVGELEASRDAIAAERDALEAKLRDSTPETVDRAAWDAMDVERRRAVVERWMSAIYVRKLDRRTNQFEPSRLDPVWKTPA